MKQLILEFELAYIEDYNIISWIINDNDKITK